jgi:thioredoxin reductase
MGGLAGRRSRVSRAAAENSAPVRWDADVAVVGGGLAGAVAALRLRRPEVVAALPVSVVLVHGGEPGGLLAWGGRRAFHVAGSSVKLGVADWQAIYGEALSLGVVPVVATATALWPVPGGFRLETSAGTLHARAVVAATGAFAMANAGALRARDGVVTAFGALEQVRATLARAVQRSPGRLVLFGPPPILELAALLQDLRPWVLVEPPVAGLLPPRTRVGTLARVLGDPAVKAVEYIDGSNTPRRLACSTVYVDFNAPMARTRASDWLAPTGVRRAAGFVAVDAHQATDVPGLFAAGDVTGGVFSVSKALHEGNVAGLAALRHVHAAAYGFAPGLYPFAHQPAGLTLGAFHRAPRVRVRVVDEAEGPVVLCPGPQGLQALPLTPDQARVARAALGQRGAFTAEALVAGLGADAALEKIPLETARWVLFSLVSLGALRAGHPGPARPTI